MENGEEKTVQMIEKAEDEALFLLSKNKKRFCGMTKRDISYHTISIPYGVEVIGQHSFQNISVEVIVLPSSVKHIEKGAFQNCTQLRKIFLPSSIEIIGDEAFLGCDNVEIYCEDEPKEGWLSGEREEIEHWDNIADAFNFHRSSGSFDDVHLVKRVEVIYHNFNPQNRPIHPHMTREQFANDKAK